MDSLQRNVMFDFECRKEENILETELASEDLLHLLSTEEDCTAILNNIASNEQFQKIINTEISMSGLKKPEVFECDICGRVCKTKKLIKKHLMRHTRGREFPCKVCGKMFRFKYEVTAHEKSHEKPTFRCDVCPKIFIHKSHLNAHKKRHTGSGLKEKTEKNVHVCETCGFTLSSRSSLKEHSLIHSLNYGKERKYACQLCGKSYITKRNLNSHKIVHYRTRPYVCGICGKNVSSKSILETHYKMHTGIKDIFCTFCDKAFASKEYLELHTRTHSGNKPFQCHICPKKFTQKTSLTVHLRFHTGERPYKCECGKDFTTKSHLMSHYKTHAVGGVEIDYINCTVPETLQRCN